MSQRLLVLYGSQTGCAHETAERIAREGRRRYFNVQVEAMDDYNKALLPNESLVLFVCSVTGQGEEPDNMKRFWKFLLRKNLPNDSLQKVQFGVFGLGDSSYPKFNFPAKKLYKRLIQLGAAAIVPRGDGDDQHDLGLDGALDPWLDQVWSVILNLYPIPIGKEMISADVLPPSSYEIMFLNANEVMDTNVTKAGEIDEHFATVRCNTRITSQDHFQDVRHVVFDITNSGLIYRTGDVMSIYPKNLPCDVQLAIEYLGWTAIADLPLRLIPNRSDLRQPKELKGILTIRELLECHLDIFGRPRRYFFELLAFFASNEQHVEKLREFASAAGQNDLYAYCHRVRRTIMEVLMDFTSVIIPVKYLFDLIPHLSPRSFSIASSLPETVHSEQPIEQPVELHLAVGIVTYQTRLKEKRHGVCTKWISQLKENDSVRFNILPGLFRLPVSIDTPIICIGVGTGIAPIRSLLFSRLAKGATENILFLGVRGKHTDYLFGNEWDEMVANGTLQLFTAFSRDQDHKVYIQHRIVDQGALLWNLIDHQDAVVFLSGNAKQMPSDVADAFRQVFRTHGKLNQADADRYMVELEKTRRYQQECWA
ncbi:NAPDH-dependent diflavin reductase [Batrachochytrium dendrobatidis]|nr:NAPDH-dependent diflavin reductase [Batrachochytrium dendrobatidis]